MILMYILFWLMVATITVVIVAIHCSSLCKLTRTVHQIKHYHIHLNITLIGLLLVLIHVLEIFLFSFTFLISEYYLQVGDFVKSYEINYLHYFYFSAASYTTVGLTSFYPDGLMTILTGLESLLGFMMITWSATFMYTVFEHYWEEEKKANMEQTNSGD